MFATFRRIRTEPGKVGELAALIEGEYLPMIDDLDGFMGYTLVDVGDDEVTSLGVFTTEEAAQEANRRAKAWTEEKLLPLVASPLEARAGAVLVRKVAEGVDTRGIDAPA